MPGFTSGRFCDLVSKQVWWEPELGSTGQALPEHSGTDSSEPVPPCPGQGPVCMSALGFFWAKAQVSQRKFTLVLTHPPPAVVQLWRESLARKSRRADYPQHHKKSQHDLRGCGLAFSASQGKEGWAWCPGWAERDQHCPLPLAQFSATSLGT